MAPAVNPATVVHTVLNRGNVEAFCHGMIIKADISHHLFRKDVEVHSSRPVDHPRNHVSCSIDRFERAAAQAIPRPLVGWLPREMAVRTYPHSAAACQRLY